MKSSRFLSTLGTLTGIVLLLGLVVVMALVSPSHTDCQRLAGVFDLFGDCNGSR